MTRILVIVNGLNGVTFHRLILPYLTMVEMTDHNDFKVSYLPIRLNTTIQEVVEYAKDYDYLVFSRLMPDGYIEALKGKIKIINDCDDYWQLDCKHPLFQLYKQYHTTEKLIKHIKLADYITTTTELLASKIAPLNANVLIYPNALNSDGQFKIKNVPHTRLRFGIIGGSSHTYDMQLLDGITQYFTQEERDKMQFVLCGFDKGYTNYYKDGKIAEIRQSDWKDVCWTRWEKNLTDNYKLLTQQHKDFLLRYEEKVDDNEGGFYKRLWTRPVESYASLYDYIDVLLVPLQDSEFNHYKSPLKIAEAGIKHKGLIISNVEPYSQYLKSVVTENGIDLEGNCIAVRASKGAKGFAKAIKRILADPDLLKLMSDNLSSLVNEQFNLNSVCQQRIEWFKNNTQEL